MPNAKPAAETSISVDLVRDLLVSQFPDLAELPLEHVGGGWDNEMYRLGSDLVVRMPRRLLSKPLVENEQEYLPQIEPLLGKHNLHIPTPVHRGRPGLGYPWAWTIAPWIDGVELAHAPPIAPGDLIDSLSRFLSALHVPAPEGVRVNPFRGVPLVERDDAVRRNIELCPDIDQDAVSELWATLRDAPEWGGPPLWLHGDLHPRNLLVRHGRLVAAIDWGDVTAGDPAVDLAIAWMVFDDADSRTDFRAATTIDGRAVDIHTWNRARGSALAFGVAVLAHSADTPTLSRIARRTIDAVMSE